ncbi:NADH:flavin oxidoreductase [Arthrobacter mobilis]|uniref:NADH:flavin oxidoreductase n=1 Tax=Arthrobacter mobilis TaxID=2724944 RepID=A0A7X6K6I9_9MICC|nr:NADH:flavin oxidoreductase [Arthrobacter mobilis]NKX55899.1 NADH:flavin oxidoreductase [Arthrobacter mobilis]
MDPLFTPLSFSRGPAMKNRFMLAPMTNKQSNLDGTVSDQEISWLLRRARGGFAHIVTCASTVQPCGRGFPGEIGVYDDMHLPGLRKLASALAGAGSVASVQLNHAGIRADSTGRVGPSADAETGARALTVEEIEAVIDSFADAAARAEAAGFHGVQIHGAHGYLIAQFLSRTINRRTDQYGGSLENRSRLLFRVVNAIRRRCGKDFQLGIRISPERYGQDFFDVRETVQRLLDEALIDYLDMSLWNIFKEPDDERAHGKSIMAHFLELDRGPVRVGVAGRIVDPETARACLDAGADYVALGKVAILHGDYPNRVSGDPAFKPRWLPVTPEYLRGQAVGESFIKYLASYMRNFVEGVHPRAGGSGVKSAWTDEQLGLVPVSSK